MLVIMTLIIDFEVPFKIDIGHLHHMYPHDTCTPVYFQHPVLRGQRSLAQREENTVMENWDPA